MLILLPTDTCYGLAWEINAIDYNEIYRQKWRDFSKRLAILVQDFDALRKYAEISDEQIQILREYPNPWSIVLPKKESFSLPGFLDSREYSNISFRVAEKCIPKPFNNSLSYPLFLTSANISGLPESITLKQSQEYFPWIRGYDGGICDEPPSDIFSFGIHNELVYLRKNRQ